MGRFVPSPTVLKDLQVDGTTMVVDESNNRLGIGTATPQAALDVAGNIFPSADAETGGHVIINGGTQTKGKFTEHDASAMAAAQGGHDDFVHLTHGGSVAGTYDAGKLVVKLYGYLF